ncbi:MAG: hypothetical protein GC157_10315 [Frankiales bacterium]|nr:hypothetical protein [Frankiales bacterium]
MTAPSGDLARLPGRPRLVRACWWTLVVLAVSGAVVGIPAVHALQNSAFGAAVLAYLLVGAVVAYRRPESPIGWIFLGLAALSGLVGGANTFVILGLDEHAAQLAGDPTGAGVGWHWWTLVAASFLTWSWYVQLYLMTFVTFLLYPSGLPSPRWRWFLRLGTALTGVIVLVTLLWPTLQLDDYSADVHVTTPNPLSPSWMSALAGRSDVFGAVGGVIVTVLLIGSVSAPFVRARRAGATERAQLRWFAYAAALFVVAMFGTNALPGGGDGQLANLVMVAAFSFIPLACGLAVVRYHLYDIDRIISRTAAYAIVTAVVVGVYAAVVTSATRLLPEGSSSLAVAAATLAAAAVVRPLLTRVQRWVDRRFNREKVDAQRTVEEYGSRLVDEVDPERAELELLQLTRQAFGSSSAALWVKGAAS